MTTIRRVFTVVLVPLLGLSGCTVARLQSGVSEGEKHVRQTTAAISIEEAKGAALRTEIARLQADLKERQMSLDELHTILGQLQRNNTRAEEKTNGQRERRRQLDRQLKQCSTEFDALKQDSNMTDEEKKRKIEHLKKEIRKALELMAQL